MSIFISSFIIGFRHVRHNSPDEHLGFFSLGRQKLDQNEALAEEISAKIGGNHGEETFGKKSEHYFSKESNVRRKGKAGGFILR